MGYLMLKESMDKVLLQLSERYEIYAPKRFAGEGCFSDTDSIRYGQIFKTEEIIFDKKAEYSFKEVFFPVSESLFFFTADQVNIPDGREKDRVVFLRSCDLHAVMRFDEIYLRNGFEDFYYKRLRERTKFILMGCGESFENCFCVSMNTNQCANYDGYVHWDNDHLYLESNWDLLDEYIRMVNASETSEALKFPMMNEILVEIPVGLDQTTITSPFWEEYSERCIACGRCNFVCPTCTCFTMQDIFYKENKKIGERRRVWASCHVDGYTEMAGGHQFREDKGQRMRFKVLHKIYDYKKRFGYQMCVGCGRCDDICPEYISFSNCVNKLNLAFKKTSGAMPQVEQKGGEL